MKSITAIIILLLYSMTLVRPALQVVDYYVQLERYKERCINKMRPELHCDGTCLLAEKIKAMDEGQGSPVAPAPLKINIKDFPVGIFQRNRLPEPSLTVSYGVKRAYVEKLNFQAFVKDIFHPPAFTSYNLG